MDAPAKGSFRQRLNAILETTAILTSVLAVVGLIVSLAIVAGYEGAKKIKAWASAPSASYEATKTAIFQRRLECSRLRLAKERERVEAELEGERSRHVGKGGRVEVLPPPPRLIPLQGVAFYSPTLNSCLYIDESIFHGRTEVPPIHEFDFKYASVEDLLTGRTLEDHEFDLMIPTQRDASEEFENGVLRRYGYYDAVGPAKKP